MFCLIWGHKKAPRLVHESKGLFVNAGVAGSLSSDLPKTHIGKARFKANTATPVAGRFGDVPYKGMPEPSERQNIKNQKIPQ